MAILDLRERGHDVQWVREDSPGIDDQAVLAQAMQKRRVLLTLDRDFGELAFHARLPSECGVILCRIPPASPEHLAAVLATALEPRSDWVGHFAVVEANRVRLRPLIESEDSPDSKG